MKKKLYSLVLAILVAGSCLADEVPALKINNSGAASKSVKVGNSENIGTFTLNGGTLTANISGTMVLDGTDASYCAAVKTGYYVGNGGVMNVTATTGNASRAISADENILITDGDYTIVNSCNGQAGTSDNYTAKALTCDKNITILHQSYSHHYSYGSHSNSEVILGL